MEMIKMGKYRKKVAFLESIFGVLWKSGELAGIIGENRKRKGRSSRLYCESIQGQTVQKTYPHVLPHRSSSASLQISPSHSRISSFPPISLLSPPFPPISLLIPLSSPLPSPFLSSPSFPPHPPPPPASPPNPPVLPPSLLFPS